MFIQIEWGTLSPKGRSFIIAELAIRWLGQRYQRPDLQKLRDDLLQEYLDEVVEEVVGSLPKAKSEGRSPGPVDVCPNHTLARVVPSTPSSRRVSLNGFALNYLTEHGREIPGELIERLQATGIEWIRELEFGGETK